MIDCYSGVMIVVIADIEYVIITFLLFCYMHSKNFIENDHFSCCQFYRNSLEKNEKGNYNFHKM